MKMPSKPGNLHPAQMHILQALSHSQASTFSALQKSTGLTSDHVNFHIKRLIDAGYAKHVPKSYGEYVLTEVGKHYANMLSPDTPTLEEQPKISIVLWIKDDQGRLLRQERLQQPFYGYWTRPTGKVRRGESIIQAAARKLKEETGLTADLGVIGVEHRIDKSEDGKLLGDKYLFIVEGANPTGELIHHTQRANNYWLSEGEYATKAKRFGKARSETILQEHIISLTEGEYVFDKEDY